MQSIKYTFKRKCLEHPEIPYDDGQTIIYLYTKGKCDDSEYGKKLSDMLKYFEDSSIITAGNDSDLNMAQVMVDNIRQNSKKGAKYMNLFEEKMFERKEGRREGLLEGKANFLEELVRKKLAKGVPEKDLPELLEQDEETIKRILDKIKKEEGVLA